MRVHESVMYCLDLMSSDKAANKVMHMPEKFKNCSDYIKNNILFLVKE